MPAPYAHFKISDLALDKFIANEEVPSELRSFAEHHSQYIHLGSVAPDYPYLDIENPEQKIWADHMHYDHTGDMLKSMARRLISEAKNGLNRNEFLIPFCWTLGYISHVTADLVVHPVVASCVGSYAGHESEHKECEMIQDSYIYHEYTSKEIKESRLIDDLVNHSSRDSDHIDSLVRTFWEELLYRYFKRDCIHRETYPQIDSWHHSYTAILKEDGGIQKFARAFKDITGMALTYLDTSDIIGWKMSRYVKDLHYPDETTCNYDDVFNIAVNHVAEQWALLTREIATGDSSFFSSKIVNCNLDTGFKMIELAFWPESEGK